MAPRGGRRHRECIDDSEPSPHPRQRRRAEFGRPLVGLAAARLYIVIFEADTQAGRRFDLWLIAAVLASVLVVMLDSVESLHAAGSAVRGARIGFTALFTVEYVARLACVRRPLRYATSSSASSTCSRCLPTYLALLFPGLMR